MCACFRLDKVMKVYVVTVYQTGNVSVTFIVINNNKWKIAAVISIADVIMYRNTHTHTYTNHDHLGRVCVCVCVEGRRRGQVSLHSSICLLVSLSQSSFSWALVRIVYLTTAFKWEKRFCCSPRGKSGNSSAINQGIQWDSQTRDEL